LVTKIGVGINARGLSAHGFGGVAPGSIFNGGKKMIARQRIQNPALLKELQIRFYERQL